MRFNFLPLIVALLSSFSLAGEPATKPTTTPADGVLSRKLVELRFKNVALADVLGFLGDTTGATVTADWNALRKVQIDVTTDVSLEVKNKTLGQVLDLIILQLGAEKNLTYVVVKDSVELTTKAAAGK